MKREILERGTHVPLIVKFPVGERAGEANEELVSGVDFAPTVLSIAGISPPATLQGQAFLGAHRSETPRRYVFAARDRMDTEYDRVRMVRDKRYRYLYNYRPDLPYYQNITFRLMVPMMNDILSLRDEGKVGVATAAWFKAKPIEELYDVELDPWELHSLVGDARYIDKLLELRSALKKWTEEFDSLGDVPEKEMIRKMWNGRSVPPATALPNVIRTHGGIRLACSTKGASIGYWISPGGKPSPPQERVIQSWDYEVVANEATGGLSVKNGDRRPAPPSWKAYDGEVIGLKRGETLHVSAMRIGYKPALIDYVDGRTIVRKTASP
jgi:N-sulfoglucosamine sulfohydrolase